MVEFRKEGSVAVLLVNNPPVNSLSLNVRLGLRDGIVKADADPSVRSIVIAGKGKFIAGANIKEFADGGYIQDPILTDLCEIIEGSRKPVVCAIEKFALGGGLELAISAHYRIAHKDTVFGFPEVDLGILPGATGTQRFPRLVGLETALNIIPMGERFNAQKAVKIGAIDKLVDGDVLKEAVLFAAELSSATNLDTRRTSRRSVKDAEKAAILQQKAVEKVSRKFPGLMAPLFAVKAIMASITAPSFEAGKLEERELAYILFTSGQSRALQYIFLAQRKAVQWSLSDGVTYKTTEPLPVHSVGIVGSGTMGSGIAMAVLNAGLPVVLVEQNEQMLERGLKLLRLLYEGSVKLGRLSPQLAEQRLRQCRGTVDLTQLKDVDLVIEAVFEKMSLKKEVFAKLDRVCKKSAVLCTNTSYLSIDEIATATKRPDMVVGTHFFVPAYHMKLLENVRGNLTSPQTIATVTHFGQHIGKVPVLVRNCHGFAGNRLFELMNAEALFLVEEGCAPHEVDRVAEDFGLPLGPFKVRDLSGLDIAQHTANERAKSLGITLDENSREFNGSRFCPLNLALVKAGRLGRKSGAGWYNYEKPGAKVTYQSDFVNNVLVEYRRKHGIEPRRITPQEILERLIYPVVNEGFRVLEEGIAENAEQIDTIFVLGYGWPRQTGGPMFYAKTVGLPNVCQCICQYRRQHPTVPHWKPSALLEKLALETQPLSDQLSRL